jgi:dTDP-4-dehydrorhamnose 3,5-epimerase-like enzyme
MSTVWQQIEARGILEIPGLPGMRVEALPVFKDSRGSLHELFRADEIRHELNPHSLYQLPQS